MSDVKQTNPPPVPIPGPVAEELTEHTYFVLGCETATPIRATLDKVWRDGFAQGHGAASLAVQARERTPSASFKAPVRECKTCWKPVVAVDYCSAGCEHDAAEGRTRPWIERSSNMRSRAFAAEAEVERLRMGQAPPDGYQNGFRDALEKIISMCEQEHAICERQMKAGPSRDKQVHLGGMCIAMTIEHRIRGLYGLYPDAVRTEQPKCLGCDGSGQRMYDDNAGGNCSLDKCHECGGSGRRTANPLPPPSKPPEETVVQPLGFVSQEELRARETPEVLASRKRVDDAYRDGWRDGADDALDAISEPGINTKTDAYQRIDRMLNPPGDPPKTAEPASALTQQMCDERRCEERVWDNGDMIDCGNRLPCAQHPAQETAARKVLGKARSALETHYALGETYTDRLKTVAAILGGCEEEAAKQGGGVKK